MIPSRRGRRGWSEVRRVRKSWGTPVRWAVALCCVAVLAGGCAKKRPTPEEGVGGGEGIGEQGLGSSDSSLDRAREGLGPAEGGPLKDVHFDYDSDDVDRGGDVPISTTT